MSDPPATARRGRYETPAQRERRLARQREYNSRRRSSASTDGGALCETADQRERRLARQREYSRRRRSTRTNANEESKAGEDLSHETADQREQRLARQRAYGQRRMSASASSAAANDSAGAVATVLSESNEQRERRLEYQRAYRSKHRSPRDPNTRRSRDHNVTTSIELSASLNDGVGETDAVETQRPTARVPNATLGVFTNKDVSEPTLTPVSHSRIRDIEQLLQAALGADLDECVCGVCDRLVLRKFARQVHPGHTVIFESMRRVLKSERHNLPLNLVSEYDCGNLDSRLRGMMLSRRGVKSTSLGVVLYVCDDCRSSLQNCGDKPPKFSIANGFFIGLLPDHLFEASWIEKVMAQLVTVVAQTRIMRGGRHRAIRSHCMVFDATPGPPATLLPRRIDRDGPYRVVLAGPMTSEQSDRIRKLRLARGAIVGELLNYFKENNAFYSNVEVDAVAVQAIDNDMGLCDRIIIEQGEGELAAAVDAEQESVARQDGDVVSAEDEDECSVIERNVLLSSSEVAANSTYAQRVVDLNEHEPSVVPRLQVHHSSRFADSTNIEAKMYPHLFPFGRGHPNEPRLTPVSKRDCIRHYAMLSSRRFAQDPTFLLTSFARLSLENMYTLTSVKCRRYGSLFQGYETLSREDVASALLDNERRQRGEARQDILNPDAARFMKSVELGSVSVWGSSAERRQCRREAFGYQTRFGQPSLFVTLTPNTDNSYAMAHYAGILSVDTLFDVLEARVPTANEMKKAAMMDDCASARLFMRSVDAFIVHVLGIDPKTSQTNSDGGLFGKTKAYYGMVETQGRGTLHIHFLIWLFGAPVNSDAFEKNVVEHGHSYINKLEDYIDSIVTTQLPVSTDSVPCIRCQASGSYASLPVPTTARREASKRKSVSQVEPLLAECTACGQRCSAQHILRRGLLQCRPPHWPPPVSQLNKQAIMKRIQQEVGSRLSIPEAAARLADREMFLASLSRDECDANAEWILEASESTQHRRLRGEDDPVKCDTMNRLIEMLPPTVDSGRMLPEHHAYMISSLVVNLNMHSWTHTGSCFKASRVTSNNAVCRYGFPRDRCEKSTITGPSVSIKRGLAHEYINGFNPTIMAAFKCNHDIQVLFGGKDAVNRIYYCCKYVTKTQRQIDSSTAVALASFQRRQAREVEDAANGIPPSITDIRRRRVTGMVHTFTNKQEIAGPLAALYVLRGSCCYSSIVCVRLPFNDVLRQLESQDDYACTLVEARTASDTVFTSASYLDDYIHRPDCTSDLSLYEYSMKCYRRKINNSVSIGHQFSDLHPLSASHCVGFRRVEAVPVITGPRLPRLRDEMSVDARLQYAKLALVLFKPFRAIHDLIDLSESPANAWPTAYQVWEGGRTDFIKTIMSNMDDYHAAQAAESDAEVVAGVDEEQGSTHSGSDCSSSDDGYGSDDYEVEEWEDEGFPGTSFFDELMGEDDTSDGMQVFPTPETFSARHQQLLHEFEEHGLVDGLAQQALASRQSEVVDTLTASVDELKRWVENGDADSHDGVQSDIDSAVLLSTADFRPTSVDEIIDASLMPGEMVWEHRQPAPAPLDIPIFSGIAALSRVFALNELQHGAFAIVATHLLKRWKSTPSVHGTVTRTNEDLDKGQLRMFLGGEGGTGKSRVIQAIQGMCRSWQRPGAVVVSAMTGKAASVINGCTLASFEMSLKRSTSRILLQDVDCLIVDEVSMMSKRNLAKLDQLLREAKRISGVAFGGIHVILVGDFLQLPPVGADPLFVDPKTRMKVDYKDFDGFNLWLRFDKVVVLRESVRFKDDLEWGEGCSKARYGEWTPAFINMINSRMVDIAQQDGTNAVSEGLSLPAGTVFVTPDNDTRSVINSHFVARTARQLPTHEFPVRIVANFKGALNKLSVADISHIMSLPDTRFGRMAPYLDLIPGMPIQMTQNVRTKKGVANGTMGTLHFVEFPPDTSFRKALDRRTGTVVLLPDRRPLYALVSLDRGSDCVPIAEGVDPRLFPVFPDEEPYNKETIQLTRSSSGESRNLSIKIQQFPFVCAVGATVYKVQGESLKSMVVVDWKTGQGGANRPQQAYLMVSRVVTRRALVCLKPFTKQLADWAKPPDEATREDRRLGEESVKTLANFYAEQRQHNA